MSTSETRSPAAEPAESTGGALASLQSQFNDLKQKFEALRAATPIEERVAQLEEAALSAADLFSDLRLACFGSDRRASVRKVAGVAAGIVERRKAHAVSE